MAKSPAQARASVCLDIYWGPEVLAGAALSMVDVLRTINVLAAMRDPQALAPLAWRWLFSRPTRAPRAWARSPGFRGLPDIVLVPGWHAHSGPDLDRLVRDAQGVRSRLQQVHHNGGHVAGIYNASALLAASGLLHHRNVAAPWPFLASLLRHDDTAKPVTDRAWACDTRVWSCDTPVHAVELLLEMLAQTPVAPLAAAAHHLYLRSAERQQVAARIVEGSHQRILPAGAVERAKRWLESHVADPYDLDATARAAATSPRSLLRHFASATGHSPLVYLQGLRVARARVLLETTYSSVEQVALLCGYHDVGTFRRLFASATGKLPASYRDHYRLRTSRKRWRGTAADMDAVPPT